jgi:hypothetical protein
MDETNRVLIARGSVPLTLSKRPTPIAVCVCLWGGGALSLFALYHDYYNGLHKDLERQGDIKYVDINSIPRGCTL